jgi:hypothetical protein
MLGVFNVVQKVLLVETAQFKKLMKERVLSLEESNLDKYNLERNRRNLKRIVAMFF